MSLISNKNIKVVEKIKSVLDQPYAASLTAICMIDNNNADLNIDISFNDMMSLMHFFDHCLNIWQTYNLPLKIYNFKDKKAFEDTHITYDEYSNNRFIISIIRLENNYTIYFRSLQEKCARILKLKVQ